jgi:glucokinase
MDYTIGIDLGGTAIKAAAVSREGDVLGQVSAPTPSRDDRPGVVEAVAALVREVRLEAAEPRGYGVGIPGLVERVHGRVVRLPNFPGWEGFPLRDELTAAVGTPLVLENDANCAAVGETWRGAAHDAEHALVITLGTGVGAGLILDGALWRGPDGYAGEFGHIKVEPRGEPCGCGSSGCVEAYASGTAIVRMAREALATGRAPILDRLCHGREGEVTPEAVNQAARAGDEAARQIFHVVARYLGMAISDVVNLLGVTHYVIGGGIAGAMDLIGGELRQAVEQRVFSVPPERLTIVRARLGPNAGMLGAAYLARDAALGV